ncbi:hypothetical protein BGZ74_002638 [Mortierella antarctica]|nr:hypothetical protein BGZ74_002638 [Mortierella antarctica]
MSGANPNTAAYYREKHPVQEEWDFDQLKILREIQRAIPMLGPVLDPSSRLTQGLATAENVHQEAPISSDVTTTGSSNGKEQAETVDPEGINNTTTSTGAGTKDDAKDSIRDNNETVERNSTPPRPKRKCTVRKKSEDETDTVAETGEPPKKKQSRSKASTAKGNGKVIREKEGDDKQMEIDESGEISEPKPIRKKQSRVAASTSKTKQKATTENVEDDMRIVAEACRAVTPAKMSATKGRPKGTTKENTKAKAKAKTKDGNEKKAKADAADGEEPKLVRTQKKRAKVTTPKAKGQGNTTTKEADGDIGDETEGHGHVTAKPARSRPFSGTGACKGKDTAYAANEEEPVLESVERKRRATANARGKAKARDDDSDEDKDASILTLMGVPKIKYKTFMALVCSKSFFVCDRCFGYSTGNMTHSDIPLPVHVDGDPADTWHLCMPCRRGYYLDHPEPLLSPCDPCDGGTYMPDERITKTRAMALFQLTQDDLARLRCTYHRNPHYRTAAPMRLYDMTEVQKMALAVHAGWVGVFAAECSVLKKKRRAYKARKESDKIRTMPKREKKPKVPKAPAAPIPDQHDDDSDEVGGSGWEDYFDDNYGEGPSSGFRTF